MRDNRPREIRENRMLTIKIIDFLSGSDGSHYQSFRERACDYGHFPDILQRAIRASQLSLEIADTARSIAPKIRTSPRGYQATMR